MAKKTTTEVQETEQEQEGLSYEIVEPTGLTDLITKYPVFDPGDARIMKPGAAGHPIHCRIIGRVELPSTQVDPETGELKPWIGLVGDLIQPAPACDAGEDSETFVRPAGTRVIISVGKVLERFEGLGKHPTHTVEVFMKPVVGKSQAGRKFWNYEKFAIGNLLPRKDNERVGSLNNIIGPVTTSTAPQLPAATANGAT